MNVPGTATPRRPSRIGRRLILMTIAFSSVITLCLSAAQLLAEYRGLRNTLDRQLDGVRIYVPNITGSVWDFDDQQIRRALDALILLPNVARVAVRTSDTDTRWSAGAEPSANTITRTYSLRHDIRGIDQEIGVLTVIASLDGIYRQVLDSALTIVLSNALKTFLVAWFMVILIRRLVTSRLEAMVRKVKQLAPSAGAPELPTALDELDVVDRTLDHTAAELRAAMDSLTELNAALEQRVDERTAALAESNATLHETIHQLERTQRELVQKEKLAALGNLVAGIAHELNTPIGNALAVAGTIEGNATELRATLNQRPLRRSEFDGFVDKAVTGSQLLSANLQRAAKLILDFKEVAVDQASGRRRRFDLRQVVDEVLNTLRPSFREVPTRVANDIPDGLWMDSFPGPLEQVVTNLVMNALIHGVPDTPAGKVVLAARALPDGLISLTVADNGKGIPAEHLDRIFDPFFTTRFGQGGSGLGLSIVHNLVSTVLGGQIQVGSRLGEGTTFAISLPARAPAEAPAG